MRVFLLPSIHPGLFHRSLNGYRNGLFVTAAIRDPQSSCILHKKWASNGRTAWETLRLCIIASMAEDMHGPACLVIVQVLKLCGTSSSLILSPSRHSYDWW